MHWDVLFKSDQSHARVRKNTVRIFVKKPKKKYAKQIIVQKHTFLRLFNTFFFLLKTRSNPRFNVKNACRSWAFPGSVLRWFFNIFMQFYEDLHCFWVLSFVFLFLHRFGAIFDTFVRPMWSACYLFDLVFIFFPYRLHVVNFSNAV